MKYYPIVLLILCVLSCNDSEWKKYSGEECIWTDSINRVFEKDESTLCDYTDVYLFEEELYSLYVCCFCQLAYPIIPCDGSKKCIDIPGCSENFWAQAEYLYSFE